MVTICNTISDIDKTHVISAGFHNLLQLLHVCRVVANSSKKEHPVLNIQLLGIESNREHVHIRILRLPLLYLALWTKQHNVSDILRICTILGLQLCNLLLIIIRINH